MVELIITCKYNGKSSFYYANDAKVSTNIIDHPSAIRISIIDLYEMAGTPDFMTSHQFILNSNKYSFLFNRMEADECFIYDPDNPLSYFSIEHLLKYDICKEMLTSIAKEIAFNSYYRKEVFELLAENEDLKTVFIDKVFPIIEERLAEYASPEFSHIAIKDQYLKEIDQYKDQNAE